MKGDTHTHLTYMRMSTHHPNSAGPRQPLSSCRGRTAALPDDDDGDRECDGLLNQLKSENGQGRGERNASGRDVMVRRGSGLLESTIS